MKSNITNYFYDKSNRVVKEIIIDKKHRDTLQITYTYSNNKLVNYLYKNEDYINEKKYINGLLNTEEESNGNGEKTINNYSYNSQDREILKQKNENGNLVYSYKSYYDKKGLTNRYEMINEKDGKSGIWLYEYDKNRRLKYKIN